MKPTAPKLFSTIVPGGMDMEEWAAGGFSKFLHPEKDCNKEIYDAINKFVSKINDYAHEKDIEYLYPVDDLLDFINTYIP